MKLCVIDDIKSVVDMITTKIPWLDYGIAVAGSALDGEAGLKLVQEVQPDIVLTDIRMPKMDGLEMTRQIMEFSPTSKIIILSAYTDFAYAQQAIRLGAFDFVKKPFSIEEIINVVLKAKQAKMEEMQEVAKVFAMGRKIKESMPALRQEYFHLLMHHQTDPESAKKRWESLDISMEPTHFVTMVAEIDQFTNEYQALPVQEAELIRFSLQNIIEETIAQYTKGVIFREALNRYVCVFNVDDNERASQIADVCCTNLARFTKFTISAGVGLVVEHIHELPQSYQQALKALSYHFYTGGNGAYSYRSIERQGQWHPNYSLSKEQDFLFALRSGNKEKSIALLDSLFDGLVNLLAPPAPDAVEKVCYDLISKVFRVLLEIFPDDRLDPFDAKLKQLEMGGHNSFRLSRGLLTELCLLGCEWIGKGREQESKYFIHEAMEYIRMNLHLDLSLEHCARQFNFSAGYFSNIFKKEAGLSFQKFVTQEKMEK
ncbi:MAG: response regulator, partial [Gorillibacterium sp.]|nr:response regulator [Gorillibacterium sp.]